MSGKGKGLKNKALTAVRAELEKHGFPKDLQLRPRRQRAEGVGYIASGLVAGKMTKLAKLRYNPETDTAVLEEDYRESCAGSPITGPHAHPLQIEREALWPEVMAMVEDKLQQIFVAWEGPDKMWRLEHFARLHAKDRRGMRHVVRCVAVKEKALKDKMRRTLHDTERCHTCIITWPSNTSPTRVAEQIIADIHNWRKQDWPKS